MLFHLLIVDDEPTIRKGLSQFIPWEQMECVVDGVACDGIEAMEQIEERHPDIVITDIRMPGCDGLELAKQIDKKYPEIQVIILTGYADFEYARQAIQYQVSSFLLKPTSREKLIEAVKHAGEVIIVHRNQNSAKEEDKKFLIEQVLQEATLHYTEEGKLADRMKTYNIEVNHFYLAAFQLSRQKPERLGDDVDTLKDIIEKQSASGYVYRYSYNMVLWIYCVKNGDEPEGVKNHTKEMIEIAGSLYDIELSAGISRIHEGAEGLLHASVEAMAALNMNFYGNTSLFVYENTMQNENRYGIRSEYILLLYDVEDLMQNWEFDQAELKLKGLFTTLKVNFVKAADAKSICTQIYYICCRILIKKSLLLPVASILEGIEECTTITGLENLTQGLLTEVRKTIAQNGKALSTMNESAVLYIRRNLEGSLSLEIIASHVHINASYLSRNFKKETGESISEYINKARIEKAQALLSFSEILTYEVAEKVGFHDPAYFSSTFKKYTGLSPKEFKQRYSICQK